MIVVHVKCLNFQLIKDCDYSRSFLIEDCNIVALLISASLSSADSCSPTSNVLQYFLDQKITSITNTKKNLITSTNKRGLQKLDPKKNWYEGSAP